MTSGRFALFFSVFSLFLFSAGSALAQTADLYVTKDGPSNVTKGTNFAYTIVVGNVGPDDAATATMNDVLPEGLTFVSISQTGPDPFICSTPAVGSGGTVTCTAATFNAGNQDTFTLTVSVPSDAADGTTYINRATIASDTFDDDDENNSSIVGSSTPPDTADLVINKSGPSAAAADTDVTYTITLTNLGPADATTVSWKDTLPNSVPSISALTFVSLTQTSGPAFTCPSPGATINCAIQVFPAGSTATFQLVAHVPPGTASGSTYTNIATDTSDNDPNPENDTSSTTLTVSSSDVTVTKSAPPTANAGGTIAYTIILLNNGPDTAVDAIFTDALSSSETFVSAVQDNGPSGSCTPPPLGLGGSYSPGGTVTCGVATLANSQSAQFTITVAVSPSTPDGTIITNTANASSNSADSNPNNNTSSASTTISAIADAAVVKTGPASATAGTDVPYTISVTNNGPADASSVTLTDAVPVNTTFVSFAQNSGPAFNCTTGATITCSIGTLTPGSTATFTMTVHFSPGATSMISNTANVSSTTADSNAGNNTSTVNTTTTASADVSITKTGASTVNAGANLTYTVTVANGGPSDAQSVSWTDTLPANTTFVSENQTIGPVFNCTTGATVTCSIGTLVSGATATFTVVVGVANTTPNGTVLSNTATVTSTTPDSNAANNTSTANTTATASADLSVTKSGPPTPTAIGYDIAYTINAANNGPTDAFNVTLADTLPANTTFASLAQTSGPTFNCTTGATVTCTIATFANGATASFTLTVHNTATAGTTVTNTATISSTTNDPNATNNTSSAPVTVLAQIPLLSPSMLMLLALALSAGAFIAMKKT
ncbi:MAG TPA: DUF11 domain-containing protein [Thermoanaerobaculia bacterium]|jgi:uncharacterized repeat protein (TIGR01451 family)